MIRLISIAWLVLGIFGYCLTRSATRAQYRYWLSGDRAFALFVALFLAPLSFYTGFREYCKHAPWGKKYTRW